jgi:hypothetical protein
MKNSNNDLENNRKMKVIEESIRTSLLTDDIEEPNECKYYTLQIFVVLTGCILILVLIAIIVYLFKN